jgi:hypothetical protein
MWVNTEHDPHLETEGVECTKFEGIFLLLGFLSCALRAQVNMTH